jgi:hypothetical protein
MRADKRNLQWVLLLCLGMSSLGRSASPFWWQQWATPAPVSEVNSEINDKSPFLSSDGLTLYFSRENEAGGYLARIFQAARATSDGPWGAVAEIVSLNDSPGHVTCPWVSADNLRLYYYSTSGMTRMLRMSHRSSTRQPWPAGTYLSELNTLGSVANPTLTEDELTIVFSGLDLAGGCGQWDLWSATRPDRDSPFIEVTNLRLLNTTASDMHPSLSPDGLMLYFASNRNGPYQIFCARRASRTAQFGHVQHVARLDTAGGSSMYPCLSASGTALYFGSQKDGGFMDIWLSPALPAYYVDGVNGNDAHDGLYPATALATIQQAIDKAKTGDVIGVGPGVYREEIRFLGKAITVQSLGDAAVLEAPEGLAVSFYMGEGPNTVLRNLVIANSYVGILCTHSSPTITNVTVAGNVYGLEAYGGSLPRVSNSIFWGNAESDLYGCDATYSCVERGGNGPGNFRRDPLFVDAENGDYHVRSARGRYWPVYDVWVLDDVTSPCIDAGDPAADFSGEPQPNGGRLNVGAHGGTAYAGRNDTPFSGDINGDGVFDVKDYEAFMQLWQQQAQPAQTTTRVRR